MRATLSRHPDTRDRGKKLRGNIISALRPTRAALRGSGDRTKIEKEARECWGVDVGHAKRRHGGLTYRPVERSFPDALSTPYLRCGPYRCVFASYNKNGCVISCSTYRGCTGRGERANQHSLDVDARLAKELDPRARTNWRGSHA
jgi:hypothetical protein